MQQLQLEVDSAALAKGCEEIMVLSRGLKELWVFGGLDTIKSEGDEGGKREREEEERRLVVEERGVREGMETFLRGYRVVRPKDREGEGFEMSVEGG